MKSYTEYLTLNTPKRRDFVNHYPPSGGGPCPQRRPRGALPGQRHAHHGQRVHQRRRAGLAPRLRAWLEQLAPFDPSTDRYHHNRTGEDNADAHLKRQVMGREVVVAVTEGKLDFGPWEQIFYGEFDGRRPKRVLVKIIGE